MLVNSSTGRGILIGRLLSAMVFSYLIFTGKINLAVKENH
jgi:hypothetical protein